MGRPRKSTSELKLLGGYRPHRHDSRREPDVGGVPEKPAGLPSDAEWMWDLVLTEFGDAGPVKKLDAAELELTCRLWALLQGAIRQAEGDPVDTNARNAVKDYALAWERSASKLGLNPRDRRSIDIPQVQKKSVRSRNRA